MEIRESFEIMEALNSATNHGIFYKAENMKVSHFHGFDDWNVTDLTNALLPGKTCRTFTLKLDGPHGHLHVTNWISRKFGNDIRALFSYCDGLEYPQGRWGIEPHRIQTENGEITVYKDDESGVRTFSPFSLSALKPLKAIPAKWTMRHVYAAIANKQFKRLQCKGVYTDDYAWDDAVNYRKGDIKSPLDFLQSIIDSPSGWRCYASGNSVAVNCHHFDTNEFIPVI